MASRAPRAVPAGIPLPVDVNLTDIMRREGIVDIHHDRLLDRFTVTLTDWSLGQGGSVGEALADAQRRAA